MAHKAASPYRRILLKISGEALAGGAKFGIDKATVSNISRQIGEVIASRVEMAVVVGGGNIWRGSDAAQQGMDRATADQAGMLATLINALVLQDALEKAGVTTRTQSAINVQEVAEPFIRRRAIRHLEKGRAVIFAAGTGNPYMTTDTAAALRAIEISADIMLMAKNRVDGVYDVDPRTNPQAKKYRRLTYDEALRARLEVMDPTALSLCLENNLTTVVFDIQGENSIVRAASGEDIGTRLTVSAEEQR